MVELSVLDFISGIFCLMIMSISIIVGIFVGIKYKKNKKVTYLYWGVAFAGMYIPWWPGALSFLSIIFTDVAFESITFIMIALLFIPIILLAWFAGFTELLYKEKQKQVLLINAIILAVAELYVIISSVINPDLLIGSLDSLFSMQYKTPVLAYLLYVDFSATITAILFSRPLIRSTDPTIKKRGIFFLLGFLTYPICGIIDGGFNLNEVSLIIIRSVLIIGALFVYFGLGVSFQKKKE